MSRIFVMLSSGSWFAAGCLCASHQLALSAMLMVVAGLCTAIVQVLVKEGR